MFINISKITLGVSLVGLMMSVTLPVVAEAQTSSVETGVSEDAQDTFEADGVLYIDRDNNGFLNDNPIKHLSTFLFMISFEEPDPPYNDSVLIRVDSESDPEIYLPIKEKFEEQGFTTKLEILSDKEAATTP